MHQTTRVFCLGVFLLVGGLQGCTFSQVQLERAATSAHPYGAITVGAITAVERLWEPLLPHFRHGLLRAMRQRHTFTTVLDAPQGALMDTSVVLSGTILEVDNGSEILRWLVGFGAGRARVTGRFRLSTAGGEPLVTFEAHESYAGGFGIKGIGLLDMEDLMRRLGATVAAQTVQWAHGLQRADQAARERQ
jgi:Domain of unknown function (DUF4410)